MQRLVRVIGFALTICFNAPALADQSLEIIRIADTARGTVDGMVLSQIYALAGLQMHVTAMPAARAAQMTAGGLLDGEVSRIGAYGKNYPRLIRVEPAYSVLTTGAYYRKSAKVHVADLAALRNYRVGYVRGIPSVEELVTGLHNLQEMSTVEALFKNLNAGQFQVAVSGSFSADHEIRRKKYAPFAYTELSRQPLYHYLHERHFALAPVLGAVIKKLADSGELEKMFIRAEQEFVAGGGEL